MKLRRTALVPGLVGTMAGLGLAMALVSFRGTPQGGRPRVEKTSSRPREGVGREDERPVYGMRLEPIGGALTLVDVGDGTPAQAAGLVPGDILVAVAGRPARLDAFPPPAEDLLFLFQRGNRLFELTMRPEPRSAVYRRSGLTSFGEVRVGYLTPPLKVGDRVGSWSLWDIDFRPHHVAADESYTLVLWSPSCGASLTRLAELEEEDAADRGRLIGITWGTPVAMLRRWRAHLGLRIPILLLRHPGVLSRKLGLYREDGQTRCPQVFRVDRGVLGAIERGEAPLDEPSFHDETLGVPDTARP